MIFGRNFCKEEQIWISEPHFKEVKNDAWPWLMARWKAHARFSIRINWTVFAIYYGSGVMRRNVYSSAVFTGGRPLCAQILPGQGRRPSTVFGVSKLDTLCYPVAKTASFWVPSCWYNTGVCQTYRQTDGNAAAYTVLAPRCKNQS